MNTHVRSSICWHSWRTCVPCRLPQTWTSIHSDQTIHSVLHGVLRTRQWRLRSDCWQMSSPIWVYAGCTDHYIVWVMHWLKFMEVWIQEKIVWPGRKRIICTCADPGIFVRGVRVNLTKKHWRFFFFFLVLSLFFRSQMVNFKENFHFQGSRGGPTFSRGGGGVQLFPGGSNCLFPIETHISCDFPGGVRTPCPPLWIRTWHSFI